MFQSYLSNCKFTVNLENSFSETSSISCEVLVYASDMLIAVKCNLFYMPTIYAYFSKTTMLRISNQEFTNICDRFVDNKLSMSSIYFGEDKTKPILFTSTCKIKKVPILDIYNNNLIKQHSLVTYLGCILEETMSGKFTK